MSVEKVGCKPNSLYTSLITFSIVLISTCALVSGITITSCICTADMRLLYNLLRILTRYAFRRSSIYEGLRFLLKSFGFNLLGRLSNILSWLITIDNSRGDSPFFCSFYFSCSRMKYRKLHAFCSPFL